MSMDETRVTWTSAHCRIFRRLFGICGAAGSVVAEPACAVVLAGLAGEFAWHAELLYELLPVRQGVDREALVRVEVHGADAALAWLDGSVGRGDGVQVCLVLGRVLLPRLDRSVAAALAATDRRLDGPRARALTLVGRGLADAGSSLEAVELRLAASGADFAVASGGCEEVERLLDAAPAGDGLAGGVARGG